MSQDHENDNDGRLDEQALRLAEVSDVSPKQAKELIEKHGFDEALSKAKEFKAES